jgi:exodeoxyribonuclease V beta subunit
LKTFDILDTPLSNTNLIEASAGTGKTYTIEGLFVRLILEKNLLVDQILVVTFTQAATEELRDRIRRKLSMIREALIFGSSEDGFIEDLLKNHPDLTAVHSVFDEALINFDKAAIFTIHGFCQKILYENAFETGNLFDTELITDQNDLIQEITDDYWRKHFNHAPPEFVSYFTSQINGPKDLARLLHFLRASELKIIPQRSRPSLDHLKPYRNAFRRLQRNWLDVRETVIQLLKDEALDGRLYGSLKKTVPASHMTMRDRKIGALTTSMDRLVDNPDCVFPLFKGFEKFTETYLASAVKKNQAPPQHQFFAKCQALLDIADKLEEEMNQYSLYLKMRFFVYARRELSNRKAKRNAYSFDDLLLITKAVLESDRGNYLADAVRKRFKAALVDEFQDTDDIQYDIFARLFSFKDNLLYFIGDPKQAIYGFRGADVFTYMKAARNVASKYTLTTNWRSSRSMVSAANTIFSNVKLPFVFAEIPFESAQSAENAQSGKKAHKTKEDKQAAITIWHIDSPDAHGKKHVIRKDAATKMIATAVAEEICCLISSSGQNVPEGDIAVLVRTNRQAGIIKEALLSKNIPSVLFTTENIFDSREAMELEKVLISISEPANLRYLKTASVTDILGLKGHAVIAADQDHFGWEVQLTNMSEYHRVWRDYGFIRMARLLIDREAIKERLLAYPDGERRLTNLLHLVEIIHRSSLQRNLGINGVLKWLAKQRNPASQRLEEYQLRLENDAQAVKIVTIHKSKGLEYPIVFCPFGWESSVPKSKEILFHDAENHLRLTLDLASHTNRLHKVYAQNELLAENLRLLYVAITRAKKRCYLTWGRIRAAETSAMAYLFHPFERPDEQHDPADIVSALKQSFLSKTEDEIFADLDKLAARSKGDIRIIPLPQTTATKYRTSDKHRTKLTNRKFNGKIDHGYRISSYSSLVSAPSADVDIPDHDLGSQIPAISLKAGPELSDHSAGEYFDDIFSFHKGARAGIFFHDIFEHIDFENNIKHPIRDVVHQKLREYGFDLRWQATIQRTIEKTVTTPLISDQNDLTLSAISNSNRINELEFYFPMNRIAPSDLQDAFKAKGNAQIRVSYPQAFGRLTFSPAYGYMKGYIDLVFRHEGKYYLVDWKSNHLGSQPEFYLRDALESIMAENFYILQYHLYTLALYQYLRLRNPSFNFERDFGGVIYIFIRGVDQIQGLTSGIYTDRPSIDLVNALGEALIPEFKS